MPPCEDGLSGRSKYGDIIFVEDYLAIRVAKGDDTNYLVVEVGQYVTLAQLIGQVGG